MPVRSGFEGDVSICLTLLPYQFWFPTAFADMTIRAYAVHHLEEMGDDRLLSYLLQLVQVICLPKIQSHITLTNTTGLGPEIRNLS